MNIELYPLGTGWDLVQTKARPACFDFVGGSTPAEMSERHRFVGGSFTAKSLTEIQEKVNLAVNAGLPESVAPVGVTASLETARSSLSANMSETATPVQFTVEGDGVVAHVSVYQS
jgi:hypothetical protein